MERPPIASSLDPRDSPRGSQKYSGQEFRRNPRGESYYDPNYRRETRPAGRSEYRQEFREYQQPPQMQPPQMQPPLHPRDRDQVRYYQSGSSGNPRGRDSRRRFD